MRGVADSAAQVSTHSQSPALWLGCSPLVVCVYLVFCAALAFTAFHRPYYFYKARTGFTKALSRKVGTLESPNQDPFRNRPCLSLFALHSLKMVRIRLIKVRPTLNKRPNYIANSKRQLMASQRLNISAIQSYTLSSSTLNN